MELVQAFNGELSSLYELKPPISKAKMSQITKVAIKGIKMYKHIVQSVERFIAKCRPEYKIPGLYVIDSIVRQSRHQFGVEKDVFGPRFTRNFTQTFHNLFITCPQEDKPKIVRVLNLWQRNNVFSSEVIQPLLDMANPSANLGQIKYDRSSNENASNDLPPNIGGNDSDNDLMISLQQLATSLGLVKNSNNGTNMGSTTSHGNSLSISLNSQQNAVRFNKKLLDFDYSEDEDDMDKSETPTEAEPPTSAALNNEDASANPLALSMAQNLLSNPELLQRLQQMQQSIQQNQEPPNSQQVPGNTRDTSSPAFISSFESMPDHSKRIAPNDVNANLYDIDARSRDVMEPDKNAYEFSYQQQNSSQKGFVRNETPVLIPSSTSNNPPHQSHGDEQSRFSRGYPNDRRDYDHGGSVRGANYVNDSARGRSRSPSPSPRRSRFSRSLYRDKDERFRRSLSRSPWRSNDRRNYEPRSPRGRGDRMSLSPESERREKEREKERERRRRGLPQIRKGYITICSTTLWLGHVPKLVSEADISNTFGEFGTINSIDLIPPRGCAYVCMNRRQDAYRALASLKNLKLHGSAIKMAWAPGKGMKGKDYKDYWDVELGASYIPYEKLDENVDLDLLEDGGMIDEETIPEKLKEMREKKAKEKEENLFDASRAMYSVPVVPLQTVPPVPTGPPPPFAMSLNPGIIPSVVPSATATLSTPGMPIGIPRPPSVGISPNSIVSGPGIPIQSPISSMVASSTTSSLSLNIHQPPPGGIPLSLGSMPPGANFPPLSSVASSVSVNTTNSISKLPLLSSESASLVANLTQTGQFSPSVLMPSAKNQGDQMRIDSHSHTTGSSVVASTNSGTVGNHSLNPTNPLLMGSAPPVFQLPLNVPPPGHSVMSRPPPPLPWLTGPPPPLPDLSKLPMPLSSANSVTPLSVKQESDSRSSGNEMDISKSPRFDRGDKSDDSREAAPDLFLTSHRDRLPLPLHGDDMLNVEPSGLDFRTEIALRDRFRDLPSQTDQFGPAAFENRDRTGPFRGQPSPRVTPSGRDSHQLGSNRRDRFNRGFRDWRPSEPEFFFEDNIGISPAGRPPLFSQPPHPDMHPLSHHSRHQQGLPGQPHLPPRGRAKRDNWRDRGRDRDRFGRFGNRDRDRDREQRPWRNRAAVRDGERSRRDRSRSPTSLRNSPPGSEDKFSPIKSEQFSHDQVPGCKKDFISDPNTCNSETHEITKKEENIESTVNTEAHESIFPFSNNGAHNAREKNSDSIEAPREESKEISST